MSKSKEEYDVIVKWGGGGWGKDPILNDYLLSKFATGKVKNNSDFFIAKWVATKVIIKFGKENS